MRNFLRNRNNHIVPGLINISIDHYTDPSVLLGIMKGLDERAKRLKESSEFLAESVIEIEESIDSALSIIEARVRFLLSSVGHLNRLKLSAPPSSVIVDIKMINMTEGSYKGTVFSKTEYGLIFASTNSVKTRDRPHE